MSDNKGVLIAFVNGFTQVQSLFGGKQTCLTSSSLLCVVSKMPFLMSYKYSLELVAFIVFLPNSVNDRRVTFYNASALVKAL